MEGAPEGGLAAASCTILYNAYKDSTHDGRRIHVGDNNIMHDHNSPEDRLRSSKRAQDRLEEYVSKGAAHDSAERGTDAPKCFPETREAVQGEMMSFVDPGGEEQMLWLSGPAGAGKTAIMGSICDQCEARGWLAASFYFSTAANQVDRCSSRYLIPTLAFHLFQLGIPGLPTAILASIDSNPSVFDKRLNQQVEILLLRPLREVRKTADPSKWPKVVVVDGVDECAEDHGRTYVTEADRQASREDNHREIISALNKASVDPAFPFRILIASRPEDAITRHFASLDSDGFKKIFLDNKYTPEADIATYCRAMFTKLGVSRGLRSGWFTKVGQSLGIQDTPRYLAEESSGQFIYAATVMRFVQGKSGTPQRQLGWVLSRTQRPANAPKPFMALDILYSGNFRTSPEPRQAAFFLLSPMRVLNLGAWYIHGLLQSYEGEIDHIFGPLQSLVRVMNEDGNPDFHIYHKSLIDFLDDPGRSGELHVRDRQVHDFLCNRTYKILKNRGPQVEILPPGSVEEFLPILCFHLLYSFPNSRKHKYILEDVSWWLSNLDSGNLPNHLPLVYHNAHRDCRWYNHRPACKIWRKGILRYAKANGWRVPTMLEELQDRVRPFPYYYHHRDSRGIFIENILHPPRKAQKEGDLSHTERLSGRE